MLLPLIFLLSAITIGYAVVLFESCLAAAGYRRSIGYLLTPAGRSCSRHCWRCFTARALRRPALARRARPRLRRKPAGLHVLAGTAFHLSPFVAAARRFQRHSPAQLFIGGALLMLGGVLLRINAFLVGYDTGTGWSTSPQCPRCWSRSACSPSRCSGCIVITRRFPVLPRDARPPPPCGTARRRSESPPHGQRIVIDPVTRIEATCGWTWRSPTAAS